MEGGQHHKLRSLGILPDAFDDVFGGIHFHLFTTNWREGLANARIEQTKVFVDFRRGSDRTTGIARNDFLLDSDSWWQAFDEVAFWFAHAPQKLAGVG